jgi:Zn-dependent protease with chaperone function
MSQSRPAHFYDGAAARRRAVDLLFGPSALEIAENGAVLARWPYEGVRRLDGTRYVLRLRSLHAPELARLEVEDGALRDEVIRSCPRLDEATGASRRALPKILAWSLAAGASLVLTVIFLVPVAADLLAPLVPIPIERRLGAAVDNQVRAIFGGETCSNAAGQAALAKLVDRLESAATVPMPIEVAVLPSAVPNAVALPGGRIYLFDGLISRAESPDEVAGVVAHEMGHVAHRDVMRALIQTGGSAFLLGLLFGDVAGGGALILVARTLIDSSHSREAETAADGFAADAMLELGRSPKPLGSFLLRITGDGTDGLIPPFLRSHPLSADRLAALEKRDVPASAPPLLTDGEWRALRMICKPG